MSPAILVALRPSERLTALVLASLELGTLLLRPPGWGLRACAFALLLLVVLSAGRFPQAGAARLVRDFLPVATVLTVFLLLQPLVAMNPHRWDAAMAAFDARRFAHLSAAWRGAFGRPHAFTDGVYVAYVSFYLLPLAVAALGRLRLSAEAFERIVFTILLGFYLSFLGYFLWPTEGPRVPPALEPIQLGGGAISEALRAFLHGAEATTLDAFPSGHTALSLLPAILATRPFPRLAPLFWFWAATIIFATVYISAHYVVDVAAGALLAVLTLILAPSFSRLLGSAPARRGTSEAPPNR
jgi:membrane-associated phospholipid phosphatase